MSVPIAQLWILFLVAMLVAAGLDGYRSLYDKKLSLVDKAILLGVSLGLYAYNIVLFIMIAVNFFSSEWH